MAMEPEALENTFRSALILLSIISFIPQYRRILQRGPDCVGISTFYVVLNLVGATEQLALGLYVLLEQVSCSNTEVAANARPNIAEYFNLAQVTVVFICHLIFFGLFLYYPPDRPGAKSLAIAIFNVFLLLSIVPVVFAAFLSPQAADNDPYHDRRWLSAIFWGVHGFYLNPLVTVLGFFGLVDQVVKMYKQPAHLPGALSATSLGAQAVVFLVVSLDALGKAPLPRQTPFVFWYQIDNLAFALTQGVLFWAVVRWRTMEMVRDWERKPLLVERQRTYLIDSRGRRVY